MKIQKKQQKRQKKTTRKIEKTKKTTEKTVEKSTKDIFDKEEDERHYCTNKRLLIQMFKWRNSTSKNSLSVYKLVKNRMVLTEVDDNTFWKHEEYKEGTRYFIQYDRKHWRYGIKRSKDFKFYKDTPDKVIEEVTQNVKDDRWAFNIDKPEEREMSNEFAEMIMKIAQKVSNHSFFRNYSHWDKEDMASYAYEKLIKGLCNYKFKYTNVFAYITQACFNSYKSILSQHYKQINIKRSLTKKAMVELETAAPNNSMSRCLRNQFTGNDYDDFSEY